MYLLAKNTKLFKQEYRKMKLSTKLAVLVLPAVFMSAGLQAAPDVFKGATLEDCKSIEKNARHVMKLRQNGTPMSVLLSRISKDEDNSAAHKISKVMVVSAYKESKAYSDGFKKRHVDDFGELWFKVCYL